MCIKVSTPHRNLDNLDLELSAIFGWFAHLSNSSWGFNQISVKFSRANLSDFEMTSY